MAVTPSAAPCTYSLGSSSSSPGSGGGAGSVTLTTTSDCYWVANSNAAWITVNAGSTNGQGPATIQFTVAANSGSSRVGTLTINGHTYTVTQAGWAAVYSVSPLRKSFTNSSASGQTVSVTTTAGCNWTAVSNNSFITITGGASGTTSGSVTYSVASQRILGSA